MTEEKRDVLFEQRIDRDSASGEQRNDPGDEPVEVAEDSANNGRYRSGRKRKPTLKTMLCGPIGLCIGLFVPNPFELLLLLLLFSAYVLLPD